MKSLRPSMIVFLYSTPINERFKNVLLPHNNMGLIDDIEADLDDLSNDAVDAIQDAEDTIDKYDDLWDDLERNLTRMNTKEVAQLYAEEDIPYDAARQMEEMVDLKYRMAGEDPFFEPMDDDDRPSEMYRTGDYRPNSLVEKLGAAVWGDPR